MSDDRDYDAEDAHAAEVYELEARYDTARAHIADLEAMVEDLSTQCNDLTVQCKFWRQAAEHAVMGWNLLEDKCEAALEALNAIEQNADAVRELLGLDEECAPVEDLEDLLRVLPTVDLGGGKLRVVEDETPFEPKK